VGAEDVVYLVAEDVAADFAGGRLGELRELDYGARALEGG